MIDKGKAYWTWSKLPETTKNSCLPQDTTGTRDQPQSQGGLRTKADEHQIAWTLQENNRRATEGTINKKTTISDNEFQTRIK